MVSLPTAKDAASSSCNSLICTSFVRRPVGNSDCASNKTPSITVSALRAHEGWMDVKVEEDASWRTKETDWVAETLVCGRREIKLAIVNVSQTYEGARTAIVAACVSNECVSLLCIQLIIQLQQ